MLPPDVRKRVDRVIASSLAPSTSKKYDYGMKAYMRYCKALNLPPSSWFPASKDLICAFATKDTGILSQSAIQNLVSALKSFHIRRGLQWNGSLRLQLALKGAANLAPASATLPKRSGVSSKMVATLATKLAHNTPADAAILAIAATALWGQARLGELLPESPSTSLSRLPTRGHLLPTSRSRLSHTLHLPVTKVRQTKGEPIVLTNESGLSNPLPILENHLRVNTPSPSDPLFSYRDDSSTSRFILTKPDFLRRCNHIWEAAGFGTAHGHSFRIGGTTELLTTGVPPDVVKKMGRWSLDHCLTYWRELESVGEKHAANARSRRR